MTIPPKISSFVLFLIVCPNACFAFFQSFVLFCLLLVKLYRNLYYNRYFNKFYICRINNEVSSSHLRGQPVAKRMNSQESPGSSTVTSSTISPPPTPQSTTISNQFHPVSRVGLMQLQIMTQPEQQHRAR